MAELLKENIQGAFLGETPVIALYHGDVQLWAAATSAVFTSSGNFVVPLGIAWLKVRVIGAGGGHGGGAYIDNIVFGGGGGGAGGYAESTFTGDDLTALIGQTVGVIVGAAGANGGYMSNGVAGGETSFAKGTAQQVIGYGGGGGMSGQGSGPGGGYVGQTGANGASGGSGGVVSSGANAPGHVIEGYGTYGGGGGGVGIVIIEWGYT